MSRARTLANLIAASSLILPSGTTAQRPGSPSAGSIRFNTTEQRYEGYNGAIWAFLSDAPSITVEYLIIAGGGGGTTRHNGGGGAGGYRSSVSGEFSGGLTSPETPFTAAFGTAYALTVGAGGVGETSTSSPAPNGNPGSSSTFASFLSVGGGGGESAGGGDEDGGSGGGGNAGGSTFGLGTTNQGFNGGLGGNAGGVTYHGGGGGGAGQVGGNCIIGANAGHGGDGIQSSIDGTPTYRAGGGGGSSYAHPGGVGGAGGGGAGNTSQTANGTPGTANTGGGGGSGGGESGAGASGGSGVIILRIPSDYAATFSAGVTQTSATVGSYTVYTVTAAGASDTVTFGVA